VDLLAVSVLVALSLIVFLIVLGLVLPAGTPRIRTASGSRPDKTVAVLERVRLGGCDQWILVRSANTDGPIILFLHGGPGTSQLTLMRRNTADLEKSFIVVNWDQRGAGKSYGAIKDVGRMNVDQFVEDTRELSEYLIRRFRKTRIVLAGHSWGSIIGALTASRYPGLYHCFVGIGQAANMEEGEAVSYQWTLQQALRENDRRAINTLQKIGPPPYQGDWQAKVIAERRCLGRFGGELHGSNTGAFWLVMRNLIFSREYSVVDRINFFRGIFGSMKLLWPQLLTVDLFRSVPELKIPVYMMEGRFDKEAPAEIAARYFDSLKAPAKELIWFEKSAHMPNSEERDRFNSILTQRILPTIER
jgi:pimeloyl-ACP methyl ester carboxylesterase